MFRVQSKLDMRPQKGLGIETLRRRTMQEPVQSALHAARRSKDVIYMVLSFCRYYNYSASERDESDNVVLRRDFIFFSRAHTLTVYAFKYLSVWKN